MDTNFSKIVLENGISEFSLSITPDWPSIIVTGMIGLGSIFTSIAVARISKNNQIIQNKAKKAELRQVWINELRGEVSNFISICIILKLRFASNPEFSKSDELFPLLQQLFQYRAKIRLMLDPQKSYTIILNSLLDDVYKSVNSLDVNAKDFSAYLNAFQEQVALVLEKAWCDIKGEFEEI
ncbi:hypothetical protein [Aliivibrio fischeri]|uniref:hypothetical protein n=1 Tax=Aliivibrio fischeri TaxID=668 RepID=UPI00080DA773|nr:hypothetical protein [Aliivibrio fischeri]OCH01866.1 hypothetical protein A6E10_18365 [Aliivibrio fischeri]